MIPLIRIWLEEAVVINRTVTYRYTRKKKFSSHIHKNIRYTVFKNHCPVEKIKRRSLDRKGTWDGLKCAITLVLTVGMLIALCTLLLHLK